MRRISFIKLSFLVLYIGFGCGLAQAQTSAFTYQGKLTDMSAAANGQYDFTFKLFDAASDGTQIGTNAACNGVPTSGADAVCDNVQVTGGIFTVKLNFSAPAFSNGGARFLEISVRPGANTGAYILLTPRQQITSAPFSIKSLNATSADSLSCSLCVTNAQIDSIDGGKVTGTVASAANATTATNVSGIVQIANGGTGSLTQNFVDLSTNQTNIGGNKTFTGTISGNGSGLTNVPGTFKWQTVAGLAQQAQPNNGYLAENGAQVTITLPTAPSVGDTVRVSGIGAGGWKIAQNEGQTILGLDLDLIGIYWTPRQNNSMWRAVASSADGTKLVAAGHIEQIYTSIDSGVTWTPRELFRRWISVASSDNGIRLVAAEYNGRLYISSNSGADWSPRENFRSWSSVASSADGIKLIAAGYGERIYTSTNAGVNWTARENSRTWVSVASSDDGTKLVAAVEGGQIYTSIDSGAT